MKMKHVKWTPKFVERSTGRKRHYVISDSSHDVVARVVDYKQQTSNSATELARKAYLIAAAPEMYNLLQTIEKRGFLSTADARNAKALLDRIESSSNAQTGADGYTSPNSAVTTHLEASSIAERYDSSSHDLYKRGDEDIPSAVLDRNGDVVLALCKVCGGAEGTLPLICPGRVMTDDEMDAVQWLHS